VILNRAFDSYVLLKRLAIGGMAELFLAMKLGPGPYEKLVVIKCILAQHNDHPDYVKLFYDEAYIAGRFNHPNVIHTYDVDVFERTHFLVMEHMSGVTLGELIDHADHAQDPLSQEAAIKLIVDVCEGLHYVHTLCDEEGRPLNIVHRDISPQNIFVTYDGQAKVFDFGIAQIRRYDQAEVSHSGSLAGKFAYMSPEQCRGDALDARSDVFSLGIILYELTTGRRLFARDNQIQTLRAIAEDPIPPPSDFIDRYPRFLERVVMKALSRDLSARYADALEMCEDLRKFLKISGSKPTSQLVSAFVKRLFATELQAFNAFVIQARQAIEAKHGRRDPLATSTSQRDDLIRARHLADGLPPPQPSPRPAPIVAAPATLPDADEPLTPSVDEAAYAYQQARLTAANAQLKRLRLALAAALTLLLLAIALALFAARKAAKATQAAKPLAIATAPPRAPLPRAHGASP
jgi:serine/threonine-protein kinase